MYEREGGHCAGSTSLQDVLDAEASFPNATVDARRMLARCVAIAGAGGRLLDVGCGFGFFSAEAAFLGFDLDPIEIAASERCVATEMLGVEPERVSFEELDRPDAYATVILMSQVLEHAHDPVDWMRKATRLLRPGGVLCVGVPSFDSAFRRVLQARDPYVTPPVHLNYFTRRSMMALMTRVGLRVVAVETVSKIPPRAFHRLGPGEGAGRRLAPVVLGSLDRVGLGMFLNAYGQAEVASRVSAGV